MELLTGRARSADGYGGSACSSSWASFSAMMITIADYAQSEMRRLFRLSDMLSNVGRLKTSSSIQQAFLTFKPTKLVWFDSPLRLLLKTDGKEQQLEVCGCVGAVPMWIRSKSVNCTNVDDILKTKSAR